MAEGEPVGVTTPLNAEVNEVEPGVPAPESNGADLAAGVDAAPSDRTSTDDDGELRLLDIAEFEPETPPLIGDDGRVRLSFSRVDAYRTCPLSFRFSYIDRLPGKPGPHLSFGTSIHSALELFYDRKLPQTPTEDELLGFLYDRWDGSGFRRMPRDEQLRWYRQAQDVLRRFHHRALPTYRLPAATEAWFELPVGDIALVVGSIDRVDVDDDGALHVVDYKTNRRVKDRARVAGSLQLALYALACEHLYGRLPASVCLDFVVPGIQVQVALADLDLDGARHAVLETAAAVQAQRFEPTPNPLCNWCDFRALCPAWQGDGPDVLGPSVVEARRLRRQVVRDVRALRELEAGIVAAQERLRQGDAPEEAG